VAVLGVTVAENRFPDQDPVGQSLRINRVPFAMSVFSQWKTLIDPTTVLLSFSFSAAVGIFFGFYTARKASQLDPIEALRHESPLGNRHFVLRHFVLRHYVLRHSLIR
jgi:ABC-type antimicrobial peptide transport system permease subunit